MTTKLTGQTLEANMNFILSCAWSQIMSSSYPLSLATGRNETPDLCTKQLAARTYVEHEIWTLHTACPANRTTVFCMSVHNFGTGTYQSMHAWLMGLSHLRTMQLHNFSKPGSSPVNFLQLFDMHDIHHNWLMRPILVHSGT